MQFTTSRINNEGRQAISLNVTENYRCVSLYNDVPQEELTFDEFEMFALDRYNNNYYFLFLILNYLIFIIFYFFYYYKIITSKRN
jgi:hypothetical protein